MGEIRNADLRTSIDKAKVENGEHEETFRHLFRVLSVPMGELEQQMGGDPGRSACSTKSGNRARLQKGKRDDDLSTSGPDSTVADDHSMPMKSG